jgi:hypothetical protein
MSQITSKVYEYIKPESVSNPDAELYEYYLVWLGVDGGVYAWLFEDFETKQAINGQVVNTKSENITKLYRNVRNSILLVAEDLTENEFDTISDIVRALVIRRYFKDGTYQSLSIKTEEIVKPKSQFRYNLALEIEAIESKIMK